MVVSHDGPYWIVLQGVGRWLKKSAHLGLRRLPSGGDAVTILKFTYRSHPLQDVECDGLIRTIESPDERDPLVWPLASVVHARVDTRCLQYQLCTKRPPPSIS